MQLSSLLLALAAQSVQAHWFLKCISKPGESCEEGSNMMPYVDNHPGGTDWPRTTPRNAINDPLVQCGISGLPNDSIQPIQIEAGTQMTAWFGINAHTPYNKKTHSNHHGYTQAYLTPFAQASPEGSKWTKIFTVGHISNGDDKRAIWENRAENTDSDSQFVGWWATDELRMNGGSFTFTVPAGTPNGKYILRTELLTNLLPNTGVPNAQVYVGCVPLQVGSGADQSSQLPAISETVSIPGCYAGNVFAESYNTFVDLSRNVPETPGGSSCFSGQGLTQKRDTSAASKLRHMSRHFHAAHVSA